MSSDTQSQGTTTAGNNTLNTPSYQKLFGSANYYSVPPSRSVLSPASYFVELMELVSLYITPDPGTENSLRNRRPDLWNELTLNETNTYTEVSKLSIVNKILSQYVASSNSSPEESKFPFNQPYVENLELLRLYLEQNKVSLSTLWKALIPEEQLDPTQHKNIQLETLGVAPPMWTLITTKSTKDTDLCELYGIKQSDSNPIGTLSSVSLFLNQTGLNYEELRELVLEDLSLTEQSQGDYMTGFFINTGATPVTLSGQKLTIHTIGQLDKIQRFIRLKLLVSWSFTELDWALQITGNLLTPQGPVIEDQILPYLSWIQDMVSTKNLTVFDCCSMLGTLRDFGTKDGSLSFFDQVYNNPQNPATLSNGIDNNRKYDQTWAVNVSETGTDSSGNSQQIVNALSSALKIQQSDLIQLATLVIKTAKITNNKIPLNQKYLGLFYGLSLLPKITGLSLTDSLTAVQLISVENDLFLLDRTNAPIAVEKLVRFCTWLQKAPFSIDLLQLILTGSSNNLSLQNRVLGSDTINNFLQELVQATSKIIFNDKSLKQHISGHVTSTFLQQKTVMFLSGNQSSNSSGTTPHSEQVSNIVSSIYQNLSPLFYNAEQGIILKKVQNAARLNSAIQTAFQAELTGLQNASASPATPALPNPVLTTSQTALLADNISEVINKYYVLQQTTLNNHLAALIHLSGAVCPALVEVMNTFIQNGQSSGPGSELLTLLLNENTPEAANSTANRIQTLLTQMQRLAQLITTLSLSAAEVNYLKPFLSLPLNLNAIQTLWQFKQLTQEFQDSQNHLISVLGNVFPDKANINHIVPLEDEVYVGTQNYGLWVKSASGSWSRSLGSPKDTSGDYEAIISLASFLGKLFIGVEANGLYVLEDGLWTQVTKGLPPTANVVSQSVFNEQLYLGVFASDANGNGLYTSADGSGWQQVSFSVSNPQINCIYASDSDSALYIGTNQNGLFSSLDGTQWTSITNATLPKTACITCLLSAGGNLYAGSSASGTNPCLFVRTSGNSWQKHQGKFAPSLCEYDGKVYLSSQGFGLWYQQTGIDSQSWTQVSDPNGPAKTEWINALHNVKGTLWAGTKTNGVFVFDGQNWAQLGSLKSSGILEYTNWDKGELNYLLQQLEQAGWIKAPIFNVSNTFLLRQYFNNANLLSIKADVLWQLVGLAKLTTPITTSPYEQPVNALWAGLTSQFEAQPQSLEQIGQRSYEKVRDNLLPIAIHSLNVKYPRNVYEHFLIDVQVAGSIMTSRVKEGISAVQLYIYRCMNQLEPNVSIAPGLQQKWNWMHSYREWQANKQVLLYPEDYLQPELRSNKTDLFTKAEAGLKQINLERPQEVDKVFREYLNGFMQVANLTVVGAAITNEPTDSSDSHIRLLCMIGMSQRQPHQYYCRVATLLSKGTTGQYEPKDWGQWKKLNIQPTPVHYGHTTAELGAVTPIYAFGTWYIFWVEQKQSGKTNTLRGGNNSDVSTTSTSNYTVSIHYSFLDANGQWVTAHQLASQETKGVKFGGRPPISSATNASVAPVYFYSFQILIVTYNGQSYFLNHQKPLQWNYAICYVSQNNNPNAASDATVFSRKATDEDCWFDYSNLDIMTYMPGDTFASFWFRVRSSAQNGAFILDNVTFQPGSPLIENYRVVCPVIMQEGQWYHLFRLGAYWYLNGVLTEFSGDIKATTGDNNLVVEFQEVFVGLRGDAVAKDIYQNGLGKMEGSFSDYVQLSGASPISINGQPNWNIVRDTEGDEYLTLGYQGASGPLADCFRLNTRLVHVLRHLLHVPNAIPSILDNQVEQSAEFDFSLFQSSTTTLPASNIPSAKLDFSLNAAMSNYFWELFFHLPFLIARELNLHQQFSKAKVWFNYVFNPVPQSNVSSPMDSGVSINGFANINRTLYASATNGIYQLIDNEWSLLPGASQYLQYTCLANLSGGLFAGCDQGGFQIKTAQNPVSWLSIGTTTSSLRTTCLARMSGTNYVGTTQGLYFGQDQTWNHVSGTAINQASITCLTSFKNTQYAGSTSGLYYWDTTQSNGSWQLISNKQYPYLESHRICAACSTNTLLIIAIRPKSLISYDGTNWKEITYMTSQPAINALASMDGTLYIGTAAGLYSIDPVNGTKPYAKGGILNQLAISTLEVVKNELYIGTSGGGAFKIYPTAKGAQWDFIAGSKADVFWKFQGLNTTDNILLDQEVKTGATALEWSAWYSLAAQQVLNTDPFDPSAVALLRPIAYQKSTFIHYIQNLLDWGDQLYRQNTRESIVEAEMLYVEAFDLLGQQPEDLGPQSLVPQASYQLVRAGLDWQECNQNLPKHIDFECLQTRHGVIYAGAWSESAPDNSIGLWTYDTQNPVLGWHRINQLPDPGNIKIHNEFIQRCGNRLYVATYDGDVWSLDTADAMGKWIETNFPAQPVRSIYADEVEGLVYAGSSNGGLYSLNSLNPAASWILIGTSQVINCISKAKGTIYTGTDGSGLYFKDPNQDIQQVSVPKATNPEKASINSLHTTLDGAYILAGTSNNGLWVLPPDQQLQGQNGDNEWQLIEQIGSGTGIADNGSIKSEQGVIFVGTIGKGVWVFDTRASTSAWQQATETTGTLSKSTVQCIRILEGLVYVGTSKGLWVSADLGKTWVYSLTDIHEIRDITSTGGIVYASTRNTVFASSRYFGVPRNRQFLSLWTQVKQRLYNIRNGLTLSGKKDELPLFQPALNPASLLSALASGEGLSENVGTQTSAIPYYRFEVMIEKAKSMAGMVINLGQSLLAALEKKDAQQLSQTYTNNEQSILQLSLSVREADVQAAKHNVAALQKNLVGAQNRLEHYESLTSAGLSSGEQRQVSLENESILTQSIVEAVQTAAIVGYSVPVIFGCSDGGMKLGDAINQGASVAAGLGGVQQQQSGLAGMNASFKRRNQEWVFQQQLAKDDIDQINYHILMAQYQQKLVEEEIKVLKEKVAQEKRVAEFYLKKFTSEQLYRWYVGQISGLYFQAYSMAYDMAIQTENAWKYEHTGLGTTSASFIKPGYWNTLKQGLLAGEALELDLSSMEKAFTDQNARRFEISKTLSMSRLDPLALIKLRTEGQCTFDLIEAGFDFDYPGHYCRQIKSLTITLPVLLGPYENIHATLTQLSNKIVTSDGSDGSDGQAAVDYLLDPNSGAAPGSGLKVDVRPNQQVALSHGVNDTGLFELNFEDARYLPFEGTGAVSSWMLEVPPANNAFDLGTLSDVIIELKYTALLGSPTFKAHVQSKLNSYEAICTISLKQVFPAAWQAFVQASGNSAILTFNLDPNTWRGNAYDYQLTSINGQLIGTNTAPNSLVLTQVPGLSVNQLPAWQWSTNTAGPISTGGTLTTPLSLSPGDWELTYTPGSGSNLLSQIEDLVLKINFTATTPKSN